MSPGEGLPIFPTSPSGGAARLSFPARIGRHRLSIYSFLLSRSQVSQPGQSRLRPSNEHCFIVRVPGAKGCPGCETAPPLLGGFHAIQNFAHFFRQHVG
jgi:hypothetical protein